MGRFQQCERLKGISPASILPRHDHPLKVKHLACHTLNYSRSFVPHTINDRNALRSHSHSHWCCTHRSCELKTKYRFFSITSDRLFFFYRDVCCCLWVYFYALFQANITFMISVFTRTCAVIFMLYLCVYVSSYVSFHCIHHPLCNTLLWEGF